MRNPRKKGSGSYPQEKRKKRKKKHETVRSKIYSKLIFCTLGVMIHSTAPSTGREGFMISYHPSAPRVPGDQRREPAGGAKRHLSSKRSQRHLDHTPLNLSRAGGGESQAERDGVKMSVRREGTIRRFFDIIFGRLFREGRARRKEMAGR